MPKKSILKKTFQFGYLTFISRILGIIRDILKIRFLGVSAMSDAFIMAYRIPNFLRKIFAEGALSSSSVPVFVKLQRSKNKKLINNTMSASFLFFEGIVALLCIFAFLFPHIVIKMVAPGFSPEQVSYAIPFVRILFPFIFFVSSSALLAAALQSIHHFFAPAFGPIILNIFFIGSLLICLYFNKDVLFLCKGIILGGSANFLLHLIIYFRYHFNFGSISREAIVHFKTILKKFIPCLLGVGIIEINLLVDSIIASFLPKGSISVLTYSNRFMQIPLGVFAVGFATVLLPYFSRITLYAPKRLKFYLLETMKFSTWVIMPAIFFLIHSAEHLFLLLFRNKATPAQMLEAQVLLTIYASGLIFFSVNKILVNIFYSLKDTKTPTIGTVVATVVNVICNIVGIYFWGSYGIAAATVSSGFTLTLFCLIYLYKKHNILFLSKRYFSFFIKYLLQFIIGMSLFYGMHICASSYLKQIQYSHFFLSDWGYWLFTIPLFLFTMGFMFLTKKIHRIKLYFLDK